MKLNKKLLETEDYCEYPPGEKNSLSYRIAYEIKENIREHKWNKGTEGVEMTWDEAVEDWMNQYFDSYIATVNNDIWPEKYKTNKKFKSRFASGTTDVSIGKLLHIGL